MKKFKLNLNKAKDMNMKKNITTLTFLTMAFSIPLLSIDPALAQKKTSAKESLERLKSNYENSVQNMNMYVENTKISEENIKSLDVVLNDQKQKQVKFEQVNRQNKQTAEKIKQMELDIQQSIQAEEKEIQIEESRIQELQKLMTQLKLNQEKRKTKIAEYQKDQQNLSKDTEAFKLKFEQTLALERELQDEIKRAEQERSSWVQKQTAYQKEVSKWKKETDRNKKLYESHQRLSE